MELRKFENVDFKLAEADHILKEANRIYDEVTALANQKSEAIDMYNEQKESNALQKHELFVKKAHIESQKMQHKADDILHDI